MEQQSIGLVLSGGGIRGVVHIGVWEFLYENEVRVDYLCGVSSGAIVAAFIAAGYTPNQMKSAFDQFISLFSVRKNGLRAIYRLFKLKSTVKKWLQEYLPSTFDQLSIPLKVMAVSLKKGDAVVFERGDLYTALLASSAIPILMKPVYFQGERLYDGGVIENMPAYLIRNEVGILIGVNTNPINPWESIQSIAKFIERLFMVLVNKTTPYQEKICDICLSDPLWGDTRFWDWRKGKELIRSGKLVAKANLKSFVRGV